jgi:hypothetical protein
VLESVGVLHGVRGARAEPHGPVAEAEDRHRDGGVERAVRVNRPLMLSPLPTASPAPVAAHDGRDVQHDEREDGVREHGHEQMHAQLFPRVLQCGVRPPRLARW